jgi:hypothetical protein
VVHSALGEHLEQLGEDINRAIGDLLRSYGQVAAAAAVAASAMARPVATKNIGVDMAATRAEKTPHKKIAASTSESAATFTVSFPFPLSRLLALGSRTPLSGTI